MEAGEKSVAKTIDTIESLPLSETLIDIRALFLQGSVLLTASRRGASWLFPSLEVQRGERKPVLILGVGI